MDVCRFGRGNRSEDERGHDAEAAGAAAAQRPEQVLLPVLVTRYPPSVGQDDLGPGEIIGRPPVGPAEDPGSAPEGKTGPPDRRTRSRRDGDSVAFEHLVDVPE